MSKMSELSQVLDELVACGEGLIRTANAIREIFSDTAAGTPSAKNEEITEPVKTEPVEETVKYSFTDVRKAFSAKSHAGFTDQVKALIARYGADKLSGVREEDYAALMVDLEGIR